MTQRVDDANRIKANDLLLWLDAGPVSAERDANLSKYFFDNGVLKKILDNRFAFLVLGRKGAGKTAVFRHLQDNGNAFIKPSDILVSLSLKDYKWKVHSLLSNSEHAESLAYKQSWRFLLLVESIKAIHHRCMRDKVRPPSPIHKALRVIERLFGEPVPSIYRIIGSKILSLSKLKLPAGSLDIEGDSLDQISVNSGEISFDEVEKNPSLKTALSQNIGNLIRMLDKAVASVEHTDYRVLMSFDHLDEAWDSVSVDVSRKVLAGLVSATNDINTSFDGKIRPIVFLREDVFTELPINDSNKLKKDCGELLKWDSVNIQKMLMRRIDFYARKAGVNTPKTLADLFEEKRLPNGSMPVDYIIQHSMMRPRDALCFLDCTLRLLRDDRNDLSQLGQDYRTFSVVPTDAVYAAEPAYSEWLRDEIFDEWEVQKPEVRQLLSAIQNNASEVFSAEELLTQLKNAEMDVSPVEVHEYLRFLFNNSIVGISTGRSQNWRYKCSHPGQGFMKSNFYKVHPGLIRVLGM